MQWLEHLIRDIRHGARNLLRTPGFTAIAVLTLALGIGANTAIFSVVYAVLLRPLGYKEPDRLVTVLHRGTGPVSTANYIDWRDQNQTFEGMGAADFWTPNLTSRDPSDNAAAAHIYGLKVTQNLFPLLGIAPLMGRVFQKGEDAQGADRKVILSHRLWQRRFQSARDVLGKAIALDGEAYTIVGVMPPEFQFAPFWATRAELWAPATLGPSLHERGGNHLRVFARLKAEASLAAARADMAAITGRLDKKFPATNRNVVVRPLKENVVGKVKTPLLMILCAVGFVLLIACANVAHMLMARTADRGKEIAVGIALGAGNARIAAQFLTENFLLALTGGAAGYLLAVAGTKALVALDPAYLPRVTTVTVDAHAALFLVCVTAISALAFGLAPTLRASRANLNTALKDGGRAGSDSARRSRVRGFLVASECALAFMLLIGAGLMVRSVIALQSLEPGFNPDNVLSMVVSVAGTNVARPGRRVVFYRDLLAKVRNLPGVLAAGGINHLPLAGDLWDRSFRIEGRPEYRPGESPRAVYRIAMPGYIETMQLPLLGGRSILSSDDFRGSARGDSQRTRRPEILAWILPDRATDFHRERKRRRARVADSDRNCG